jgi:hypothetical protein
MRSVSRIDIVLENCEVIGVPAENVGEMRISGISRTISRIAVNSINETTRCKEFFIELLPSANETAAFQLTFDDGFLPFERLTLHHDICAIDVIYDDGTNEYIYVPWGGLSDYVNEAIQTTLTQNGRLRITIEETEVSA